MRSMIVTMLVLTLRSTVVTHASLRGALPAVSFANASTPALRMLAGGAADRLVEEVTGPAGLYPVHVDSTFGPASDMRQKVLDGEPCDVVILTDVIVGELVRTGHVVDGSAGSLGFVATALAQLRGAGAPVTPATAEELKRRLEGASALHVPDLERSTAGKHVAEVLKRLELWEALAPRVVETAEGGQAAMRKLAESGDAAALGCTQVTEILAVPGVEVVGELPPGYRLRTSYVAAVCAGAADPERAWELVQALAGADTTALRRELGFIDTGDAATVSDV